MKNRIISVLGKNGTTPAVINDGEKAVYTYKNDVYCLKGGMDMEFDELDTNEQEEIVSKIESDDYKLDNTYQ